MKKKEKKHYAWSSENQKWPLSDWKYEVANDDTRLGYWEWVEHKRESQ